MTPANRAAEIDALSARAEALPPGELRDALEELAFLLDDGPGPGAPERVHEHHNAMVADRRADVTRLEGLAKFDEMMRGAFAPLPPGFR